MSEIERARQEWREWWKSKYVDPPDEGTFDPEVWLAAERRGIERAAEKSDTVRFDKSLPMQVRHGALLCGDLIRALAQPHSVSRETLDRAASERQQQEGGE